VRIRNAHLNLFIMTTTEVTPETKKVMTTEELALEYYEHRLDRCKKHVKASIADYKKEQMAVIIADTEYMFSTYIMAIENIRNNENLENIHEVERIIKLRLIENILKF
jgi:hypothetical protein